MKRAEYIPKRYTNNIKEFIFSMLSQETLYLLNAPRLLSLRELSEQGNVCPKHGEKIYNNSIFNSIDGMKNALRL
ncbi:MAG: hypothetical protein GY754_04195 [bacterium]|nr:hypothetical protein [bacterium]